MTLNDFINALRVYSSQEIYLIIYTRHGVLKKEFTLNEFYTTQHEIIERLFIDGNSYDPEYKDYDIIIKIWLDK